jgi:uncharacterized protein
MVLRILSVLTLVVFCFLIGDVAAASVTSIRYGVSIDELYKLFTDPAKADRDMITLYSGLSSLFRFMIVPGFYFLFTDKDALDFLRPSQRLKIGPSLMIIALIVCLVPVISVVYQLNNSLSFPDWMSGFEATMRANEDRAREYSSVIVASKGVGALMTAIIVAALIPGIAEEIFFRGIVQTKLQSIFRKDYYAVLACAALFSFIHFQFFGFLPRLLQGVLIGYIFLWSRNIWYPVIAHTVNNMIGVLMIYFIGPQVTNPSVANPLPIVVTIASTVLSILLVWLLRKSLIRN